MADKLVIGPPELDESSCAVYRKLFYQTNVFLESQQDISSSYKAGDSARKTIEEIVAKFRAEIIKKFEEHKLL